LVQRRGLTPKERSELRQLIEQTIDQPTKRRSK
jgi:hypothetical protein